MTMTALYIVERILSRVYLTFKTERHSIIGLMFHSIFNDEKEVSLHTVEPQQVTTVDDFRACIDYFASRGYRFVSPLDIKTGIDPEGNYVLVTLDDGYFNNSRIIPILEEYCCPAVFFVASGYVASGKSFWWDVIYRERRRQGIDIRSIRRETKMLIRKRLEDRELYLKQHFPKESMYPKGETDRPFAPDELRAIAREKYAYVGNHTSDHLFLPICSSEEIGSQLSRCQDDLSRIVKENCMAVSYPYGAWTRDILQMSREMGFEIMIAGEQGKNCFPISDSIPLGRFHVRENARTSGQCEIMRSDLRIRHCSNEKFHM